MNKQSTKPKVIICTLARDRAWCLPVFFRFLDTIEYPKSRLHHLFIVNGVQQDNTLELIQARAEENKNVHIIVDTEEMPPESANKADRATDGLYLHLARLRDIGLRYCQDHGYDYIFQLDSDVMVLPNVLDKLVSVNVDYSVASIVQYNIDLIEKIERDLITLDYTRNTKLSNPYRLQRKQYWRIDNDRLLEGYAEGSGISLISRRMIESGCNHCYEENKDLSVVKSEDITFAEKAKGGGFQCWRHSGAVVFHLYEKSLMTRSILPNWNGYST